MSDQPETAPYRPAYVRDGQTGKYYKIGGGGADGGDGIPKSLVDAKGDLIVGSAADAVARLPVGTTNGNVLTVDSAAAYGVKWAAPTGGSGGGDEVLALPVGAAVPANTPTGTLIVRYE